MRKRIMTLLMVLASMMVSTTYAQEIYKLSPMYRWYN